MHFIFLGAVVMRAKLSQFLCYLENLFGHSKFLSSVFPSVEFLGSHDSVI